MTGERKRSLNESINTVQYYTACKLTLTLMTQAKSKIIFKIFDHIHTYSQMKLTTLVDTTREQNLHHTSYETH